LNGFVLDASVTAAWCFEDQSTPYTDAVLQAVINGAEVVVPAIWSYEVANIPVVAERRKKLTLRRQPVSLMLSRDSLSS
jgi:hypothetical protein